MQGTKRPRKLGEMSQELLDLDPKEAVQLTQAIAETIGASFVVDKNDNPTQNETQRRFRICVAWYRKLHNDHHYALQRVCDELPQALRSSLDGTPYKPGTRKGWASSPSKLYYPQ